MLECPEYNSANADLYLIYSDLQVAERGLALIQSLSDAMGRETEAGRLPQLFKQAWVFSACISLADTTVRIGPPPPTPKSQTPMTNRQTSRPPRPETHR